MDDCCSLDSGCENRLSSKEESDELRRKTEGASEKTRGQETRCGQQFHRTRAPRRDEECTRTRKREEDKKKETHNDCDDVQESLLV